MVTQALTPPTTRLPPIAKLVSSSPEVLIKALHYLRSLYNPEVRGSRRVKKNDLNSSLPSNTIAEPDSAIREDLDLLRADAYERTYTMRWLTALIARASDCEMSCHLDRDPAEAQLAAQCDSIISATSFSVRGQARSKLP